MNRPEGRRVVITGATAGIGEACARRFAAQGDDLLLWARRLDRLRTLASELESETGVRVECDAVDVRDRSAVETAARAAIESGPAPDVLVNNAGLASGLAPIQSGDPEDWEVMIDTNVKGLLWVTRALLPAMLEAGRGHVVNIGSIAGHQVYPQGNVYVASKFAVNALSQALNLDLLGTPIRVSSIDPGHVRSEFAQVRFHGDEARAEAVYEGFEPLRPEDVADAVAYAVNAPSRVNIANMILFSTAQRSVNHIHREKT